MNIALDHDGTFTADPDLWLEFVRKAMARGHSVKVVTMRFPSECTGAFALDKRLTELTGRPICTSRKAKKPYCTAAGLKFDIWIDDHPEALIMDAEQAWGGLRICPEGEPHDPVNDAPLKKLPTQQEIDNGPHGGLGTIPSDYA